MRNEVKNQEKNVLEERREIYIRRINGIISHINLEVKEKKEALAAYRKEMESANIKFHTKIINLEEQKKSKLTEYKKEIENAKDQEGLVKVWLDVLEDKSCGLDESIWYDLINSQLKHFHSRIEYKPEESHRYMNLVKRYQKMKEMLIEGREWFSVWNH